MVFYDDNLPGALLRRGFTMIGSLVVLVSVWWGTMVLGFSFLGICSVAYNSIIKRPLAWEGFFDRKMKK